MSNQFIDFEFGTPEHGWLEIKIFDNEKEIIEEISDVPCNSLLELTKALLNLKEGRNTTVEFSLEPAYVTWDFTIKNDMLEVRTRDSLFSGQKERVLQNLFSALKKLEADECWSRNETLEIWSNPFPNERLESYHD